MKKVTAMFLAGIITGLIISFAIVVLMASKVMFTESESRYNFTTTKAMLEKAIVENEWSMPYQYDLQATMNKNGFSVRPVTVFSICKPDIAMGILGDDANRHVSAMMPCRIAVYEKADGKTYISRMNAGLLSKLLGPKTSAIMGDAASGSEAIIKQVTQE